MKDLITKIFEFFIAIFKREKNEIVDDPIEPNEPIDEIVDNIVIEKIEEPVIDDLEPKEEEIIEEPIIEQEEVKQPTEDLKTPNEEVVEVKEKYIPRLTAPSTTDKNWIKNTKDGYNYCMEIKNGSCLPNCVGYAWGRWRELLGAYHKLSRGNAENWYGKNDGYKRGQTPKLGAVICWRKGKAGNSSDGAGHVAIVEQINSDGSIIVSNSAYNGTRFYTKTIKKDYVLSSKYTFQGFIYLPKEYDGTIFNLTKTLSKGSKGDEVKQLQRELKTRGYNIGKSGVDGIFGGDTGTAVMKFQKANNLTQDGKVGKNTAHKLGWLYKGK